MLYRFTGNFRHIAIVTAIVFAVPCHAQSTDENEALKIAAVEALMSAPAERALPIVKRVMQGNHSNDVKERALFILSQIDSPEAQEILIETAESGSGELQNEAIRMIGISGDAQTMARLKDIYAKGNADTKESVLEAYLIADDAQAVYEIALGATGEREFEEAVEMLGAMGALAELRALRENAGNSEILVEAYAIAGDHESLREMALDASDTEIQVEAITGLGIVGGAEANATLLEIYRATDSAEVREAVLDGMLISGYDEGVLTLFRESDDAEEKRDLLEMLVIMESDAAMQIIDETLGGNR
jgi:HEAT repeat protein